MENDKIYHYIINGDFNKVKKLIKSGCDVNIKDHDGDTPLCYSLLYKCLEITDYLLNNGADVNSKNRSNETPFHYCKFQNDISIYKKLLNYGGDPFIKDDNGKTPLDYCKDQEFKKNVERLFKMKQIYENNNRNI